jgi:hypothetical protein
MMRRSTVILVGVATGVLVVLSVFVPGWAESILGRALFWPVYLVVRAFPPPCFDQGPGREPFCEGTPVQVFAALFGLVLTFVFYAGLGAALCWRLAQRAGRRAEPAA